MPIIQLKMFCMQNIAYDVETEIKSTNIVTIKPVTKGPRPNIEYGKPIF